MIEDETMNEDGNLKAENRIKEGSLLCAHAVDPGLSDRAGSGGAVTALLKFALENELVDAVLAVKKGADIYDAVPVFITDPAELSESAGSLHFGTLLLSRLFPRYLEGAEGLRIGVALKGCDVMGLYELAKRGRVNLDNLLMLGLNCGGSISPESGRKMIAEKYSTDPDSVIREEIAKGKLFIRTGAGEAAISMDELEKEGYGRRSNCRRCKMKIPRQADLACGAWGAGADQTFIEVGSVRGAELLERAREAGIIETGEPTPKAVEIRGRIEKAMLNLADRWRTRDFETLGEGKARLKKMIEETSRCIKCYTCVDVCPALFEDKMPYRALEDSGKVPPAFAFHQLRWALIADSCINCGQCEELCPMDIPNSLFAQAFAVELEELYGYHAGMDLSLPKVAPIKKSEV